MTTFAELPEADQAQLRRRLAGEARPRRTLLRMAGGAAMGAAFGSLGLVNRLADRAQAAYFTDYTDEHSGPCDSYASNHTEEGRKCGPSTPCNDYSCCWKYRDGAGNEVGWHQHAPNRSGYFRTAPTSAGRAPMTRGSGPSATGMSIGAATATPAIAPVPAIRASARGR